jgi:phosphatidylglycerophosphate synthase
VLNPPLYPVQTFTYGRPRPYRYHCVDRSRLTAWIATQVAPPIEARLYAGWSANTVTWLGSGLMWVLLTGVLICPSPLREQLAPFWVALLWGYCLLDHVDGCRARSRHSSSPWGEFLDHGLDAYHGAIAVIAVASMGDAVRPGILTLATAGVGIVTAATWIEQRLRGTFTLAAIGPVEAVMAAGCYIALWGLPGASMILAIPVPYINLTWSEIALLAGTLGCTVTTAAVALRSPDAVFCITACIIVAAGLLWLGYTHQQPWHLITCAVLITFAEYSARVITSHLVGGPAPWPDLVGPLLMSLGAGPTEAAPVAAATALLWLLGRVSFSWWSAARRLKPAPNASAVLALGTKR